MLKSPAMLAAVVWLISASAFGGTPWTHPTLRTFARDSLTQNLVKYRPPRIIYGRGVMWFDLGDVNYDANVELWSHPLESQFRVELIRRYRSAPQQRQSWAPHLTKVETIIQEEIALLNKYEEEQARQRNADSAPQALTYDYVASQLFAHDIAIREILVAHLNNVARSRGLRAQEFHGNIPYYSAPRPVPNSVTPTAPQPGQRPGQQQDQVQSGSSELAWRVRIAASPTGASIYYLPEFVYQWNRRRGEIEDLQQWQQLLGNVVDLSGNYRFYVRWDRLGRSKLTSKVSITRPQTLYLQP